MVILMALIASSCKKQVTEVPVDAFSDLNTLIEHREDNYLLLFTLQEYPYLEVGVRLSADRNAFYKNTGLVNYLSYPVSKNRYGVFLDTIEEGKTYYYQIYVKDSQSPKEAYSDVYSFKATPLESIQQ